MDYVLKGGEYIKGGKLYGWTGQKCCKCNGNGHDENMQHGCTGCGGTGDEHGLMPIQPANLGPDTE